MQNKGPLYKAPDGTTTTWSERRVICQVAPVEFVEVKVVTQELQQTATVRLTKTLRTTANGITTVSVLAILPEPCTGVSVGRTFEWLCYAVMFFVNLAATRQRRNVTTS